MNELIAYFESIPSSHRAAILAGGIAVFWILESAVPFFKFRYNKWQHAGINIFFTLTTILINFLLAFILVTAADWVTVHHFGLLNWMPTMPSFLYAISGLLL
ncbi:MAG: sterol desaturase, partial [Flavobacterium stagni]